MVSQTLDAAVGTATLHNPGLLPPYPVPVLPTRRSRPRDPQAQVPTQTQSHIQTQTRSEFLTPSPTKVQPHPQSYSYPLSQPRFQSHQQQQAPSTTPSLSTPRQDNFASFRPDPRRPAVPAASTEVISSLITSLSDYSVASSISSVSRTSVVAPPSPAPSPALPAVSTTAHRHGSFGVDYGAFSYPAADPVLSLDDLAAAPPVIRTAKPPSGFSALTAPKVSPTATTAGRDPFGSGLKSRLSRPSSRASDRDETRSIGNLSIERGLVLPTTSVAATTVATDTLLNGANVLRTQRSHDSWGRNQARNSRGLMYMSSKEQLREREQGKKRTNINTAGSHVDGLGIGIGTGIGVPIPSPGFVGPFSSSFPTAGPLRSTAASSPTATITTAIISMSATTTLALAETPITEEPASVSADPPWRSRAPSPPRPSLLTDPSATPWRSIPTRDSSLRKVGPHTRRLSRRIHDLQDGPVAISNLEKEADSLPRRGQQPYALTVADRHHRSAFPGGALAVVSSTTPLGSRRGSYDTEDPESDLDDGAPFPAVAQGPATHFARHRSERYHADHPADVGRIIRSGSRIKRLSGRGSPRPDDVLSSASSPVPPPLRGDSPDWPRQHPRHKAQKRSQQGLSEQGGRQSTQSLQHQYQLPAGYERPHSPDSVDDAVESYLCSPRLSQRIRHPQTGRIISFSEVGDSQGSAVFCCVGMGLTRYITAFYDELALTLKLRLITPDRPGVGDSESPADGTATPLGWPDDVYTICQALKITKFSILAHSAGAIYALATALRMPQHIRGRIHLLAPWIPPSQMNVFGTSQTLPPNKAMPTSQRILRALPTPILKAANSSFMTATSSSITSSLPKTQRRPRRKTTHVSTTPAPSTTMPDGRMVRPGLGADKENTQPAGPGDSSHLFSSPSPPSESGIGAGPISAPFATENMDRIRPSTTLGSAAVRPEDAIISAAADALADKERQHTYDIRLTHAIWELATTGANPAVDLLVCLERRHTIGFRYVDITRPVVIHHGSRDTRVPVENVRWLGKMMRRCEVRVLEGEGHGLMASASVMGAILMEISKEWEDWMRVTGNLNPSPLLASSASGFTSVRRTAVAGR